ETKRVPLQRRPELLHGRGIVTASLDEPAKHEARLRVSWIQLDRALKLRLGLCKRLLHERPLRLIDERLPFSTRRFVLPQRMNRGEGRAVAQVDRYRGEHHGHAGSAD